MTDAKYGPSNNHYVFMGLPILREFELELSNFVESYDLLVILDTGNGYYYAQDSGCSCGCNNLWENFETGDYSGPFSFEELFNRVSNIVADKNSQPNGTGNDTHIYGPYWSELDDMVKFFAYCIEEHANQTEPEPKPKPEPVLERNEWFFLGDTSSYIVEVISSQTKISSQVKVISHLEKTCSLPIGSTITVSNRKLFKDFSNILKVRA